MSLDVSLLIPRTLTVSPEETTRPRIFIREKGSTKEISQEEWNKSFPGKMPVTVTMLPEPREVFNNNITHNLNTMAKSVMGLQSPEGKPATLYDFLWHPEDMGIKRAHDLISPLIQGLRDLNEHPETYKKFNPENGWGKYENLVDFVSVYLSACMRYPNATVEVSR